MLVSELLADARPHDGPLEGLQYPPMLTTFACIVTASLIGLASLKSCEPTRVQVARFSVGLL